MTHPRTLFKILLLVSLTYSPWIHAADPAPAKRLEDNPEAMDKLREILQKGIPEKMTVRVTNPAGNSESKSPSKALADGEVRVQRVAAPVAPAAPAAAPKMAEPKAAEPKAPDPKVADKKPTDPKAAEPTKAEATPAPKPPAPKVVKTPKPAKPTEPVAAPVFDLNTPWSYAGSRGPEHWGKLNPAFATCGKGSMQSPIHLDAQEAVPLQLDPLELEYGELMGKMVHTGHTVMLEISGGNILRTRGKGFGLAHIQFKHPAEQVVNQRSYPMSLQFVHRDFQGQVAIVSVLVEAGAANPAINKLWSRLPLAPQERNPVLNTGLLISELMPKQLGYSVYTGSLSTPPCTEGVLWIVLKQPITLSPAQIEALARLTPPNARPVQPSNGRLIQTSLQ